GCIGRRAHLRWTVVDSPKRPLSFGWHFTAHLLGEGSSHFRVGEQVAEEWFEPVTAFDQIEQAGIPRLGTALDALGQSEVGDERSPVAIEQYVGRFQVSVCDGLVPTDHLEGDNPARRGFARLVYDTHAAAGDLLQDFVAWNLLSGGPARRHLH